MTAAAAVEAAAVGGTVGGVERELRDWMKALAAPPNGAAGTPGADAALSDAAADRLARIATDGTLRAVLDAAASDESDLAG